MPVTTPEPVQSAQLYYGSDTVTAGTEIFNLVSITVPDQSVGEIEWTHLHSTYEQFIPSGIRQVGELGFRYHMVAALYNTIEALKGTSASAIRAWRIGFPDTNGTIDFLGFLKENKPSDWDDPETIGMVDALVRVVGAVTITVGS